MTLSEANQGPMTLEKAKILAEFAEPARLRPTYVQLVAKIEARMAAGGPEEAPKVSAGNAKGVPTGENPYDNAFNRWLPE